MTVFVCVLSLGMTAIWWESQRIVHSIQIVREGGGRITSDRHTKQTRKVTAKAAGKEPRTEDEHDEKGCCFPCCGAKTTESQTTHRLGTTRTTSNSNDCRGRPGRESLVLLYSCAASHSIALYCTPLLSTPTHYTPRTRHKRAP